MANKQLTIEQIKRGLDGLTRSTLCKATGLSTTTIWNLKTGLKRKFSQTTLNLLSEYIHEMRNRKL